MPLGKYQMPLELLHILIISIAFRDRAIYILLIDFLMSECRIITRFEDIEQIHFIVASYKQFVK